MNRRQDGGRQTDRNYTRGDRYRRRAADANNEHYTVIERERERERRNLQGRRRRHDRPVSVDYDRQLPVHARFPSGSGRHANNWNASRADWNRLSLQIMDEVRRREPDDYARRSSHSTSLALPDDARYYPQPPSASSRQISDRERGLPTSESADSVEVNYSSVDRSVGRRMGWDLRQTDWARPSSPVLQSYNHLRSSYTHTRTPSTSGEEDVTRSSSSSSTTREGSMDVQQWRSGLNDTSLERPSNFSQDVRALALKLNSLSQISSSHDPDIDRADDIYPSEQMHAAVQAERISVSDGSAEASVKTPVQNEEQVSGIIKCVVHLRDQLATNCTPHWPLDGFIAKTLVRAAVVFLSYGAAWAILGDDMLPCSLLFSFALLTILSSIGGFLARIIYLPPLVGMILVGFLFKNIPEFVGQTSSDDLTNSSNNNTTACGMETKRECYDLDDKWSSIIRSVALVIILTRAGLCLNAEVLKHMKFIVSRLAFLPSLAEASVEAGVAHYLLDMPWDWAFMTGFVNAAISPAVVVLGLISLQKRGYGTAQGIPTLLIAAATGDDALNIGGFSICLSIAFREGSLMFNVFRPLVELALGLTWGCIFGVLSWWLPSFDRSRGFKARNRLVYLLACGLLTVFGGKRAGFTGAAALGVVVMSFVASRGWNTEKGAVSKSFKILWEFAQPALFGLTGASVDVDFLAADIIGLGLAMLAAGLVARLLVTYLAVCRQGFTKKERIFIALAWLPKATVQAAIGSIAFDKAKECSLGKECEGYKELGKKLVTVSFLVIVMCAPIGAAAIQFSGPHLLRREQSAGLNSSVNDMVGSAENGRSLGQNKSANNTRVDVNGMETSV